MADITLGDYAGFILQEMVRARETADAYSRAVAERYAADPVLQFFPAPRFKIPKLDLTMPIFISAARFKQTVRLDLPLQDFVAFIAARADDVRSTVALAHADLRNSLTAIRPARESPAVKESATEFRDRLMANPDPHRPESIVSLMWSRIFRTCLAEVRLLTIYTEWDPSYELLARTKQEVLDMVLQHTVVDRTEIESLLVNPETSVVKNGSGETSTFTVKAELLEEGVYFRSVVDDKTQQKHTIVEFE